MQSFRATYGWLGINITSRLLVKEVRDLIGTAKNRATFCTTMARGMGMRRLVDGYEPTVWPVLRNGRYMIPAHMMSTETRRLSQPAVLV